MFRVVGFFGAAYLCWLFIRFMIAYVQISVIRLALTEVSGQLAGVVFWGCCLLIRYNHTIVAMIVLLLAAIAELTYRLGKVRYIDVSLLFKEHAVQIAAVHEIGYDERRGMFKVRKADKADWAAIQPLVGQRQRDWSVGRIFRVLYDLFVMGAFTYVFFATARHLLFAVLSA